MLQTVALLIAIATAQAGAPVAPLPAESPRAYQCRASHVPVARACAARCEADLGRAGQEEARWGCLSDCTRHALRAMAGCRSPAAAAAAAGEPADAPLARR
jgi:hypothetical protein